MIRQQQSGRGLGSDILLTLVVKDEAEATAVFKLLWASIAGFEQRFSRFIASSELTGVNQRAGTATTISPAFYELLQTAVAYSQQTASLYNPLILPALQQAGYVGSWPQPQSFDPQLDYRPGQLVSVEDIELDDLTLTLPAGAALDFGGIGKGYLLDQLANLLDTKHVKDYWLSLGGDILCQGFNLEQQPWRVGLAHAEQPEEVIKTITNQTGQRLAIATSGITKRRGKDWHHLIDPRTGKSAETTVLTASVVSDTATAADVGAKCLVILDEAAAKSFVASHSLSYALLQIWHTNGMQVSEFGDAP